MAARISLLLIALVLEVGRAVGDVTTAAADAASNEGQDECRLAVQAWEEAESTGGCGGKGSADPALCARAEELCKRCRAGSPVSLNRTGTTLNGTAEDTEGLSLAELDAGELRMQCTSMAAEQCDEAMADQPMILLAGFLLFAVSTSVAALFDRIALPLLLRRWRFRISDECPHHGGQDTLSAPPLQGLGAGASGPAQAADLLRLSATVASGAPVPPGGPKNGDPAPVPPSVPAGCAAVAVTATSPAQPTVASPAQAVSMQLAHPSVRPPNHISRGWPRRLASVWASRLAFLWVAAGAAAVRLAQIVLCAALELGRSEVGLTIEALICIICWLWCWAGSRQPAVPECGIPGRAAHGGPCGRLPRFTTFALLTAGMELYSTAATAWAVAGVPCGTGALAVAVPYCVGVAAVAARVYSALLALRLQDELIGATVRVVPAIVDMDDIEFDLGACVPGAGKVDGGGLRATGWEEPTKPSLDMDWPQKQVDPPAALGGSTLFRYLSCRACGWSTRIACLLRLVLLAVVVIAVSSFWVARALGSGEEPAENLPSSCATAQNGTSTCVPFRYVGENLWDHGAGKSHMEMADTMDDCCAGCDQLEDCQAWIFEERSNRCRWIRFEEDPCLSNPSDLGCRCITHYGMTFGFKPTSQIVWMMNEPS